MAYEKQTWANGDVITAEKLNHIEEGIENGDNGYECTETTEQLFNETVTTVEHGGMYGATFNYSHPINADELTVVFNGTEYVCPKIISEGDDNAYYGGYDSSAHDVDFTDYPFSISSSNNGNVIVTESPMTVTVSASVTSSTVETTECFEKAVSKIVSPMLFECKRHVGTVFTDDSLTTVVEEGFLPKAVIPEGVTAYGIKVVLDGVDYFSPRSVINGLFYYGSVDFNMTDFPFVIEYDPKFSGESTLYTETAGVHSIRIEEYIYTPTNVSPCLASVIEQIVTTLQGEK